MKISLSILITLLSFQCLAQVKISGHVVDQGGKAIPGVNVFLAGTYDGASTDAQGHFEFETQGQGSRLLTARFVGYKEFTQEIEIESKNFTVTIKLIETINELQAVTITAGAFTASDVSRRTVFRALDIATTAG